MATLPRITWSHPVNGHMDCPDDGVLSHATCVHDIDLDGIRKRAQDYIDTFGAGNWGRTDDVWIDTIRPSSPAQPQDAVIMGRFVFAVSPDAMLAIIDALEHRGGARPAAR